jgi:DNA repair exonuclease SbcCD ATPase subunit
MALTGKVEPQFGWQNQAAHLALTHTPMGVAAMTLAKRARGRTHAYMPTDLHAAAGQDQALGAAPDSPHGHPADDFTAARERELQTQLARQKLAARQMRERIEALSRRAEEADKRYADLEDELNVAREEILLQQNDKHSLQAARDLLVDETAELTRRLTENHAALEQARDQIERAKAALNAATLAQNSLQAALADAHGKERAANEKLDAVKLECRTLTAALSALHRKHAIESSNRKALKIERNKLLTALDRANQKNQAQQQELKALQGERDRWGAAFNKSNERHRAEIDELKSGLEAATSRALIAENLVAKVRDVLLEKFALLQASVETKNCELHELERSRTRLIDGTKMLLEIFAMRDVALSRADARIRFLTDRIADLEAEPYRAATRPQIEIFGGMHGGFLEQNLAGGTAGRAAADADNDLVGASGPSEPPPLYLGSTMLAATVTF